MTAVATSSRSLTALKSLEKTGETDETEAFMIPGCYVPVYAFVSKDQGVYQESVANPAGAAMESKLKSRLGNCKPKSAAASGRKSPPVVSLTISPRSEERRVGNGCEAWC